jgi:hypothetical protein
MSSVKPYFITYNWTQSRRLIPHYGDLTKIACKTKVPKTIGFPKDVGRQHTTHSSNKCLEPEKEDLRDTLNKGYHLYPINWRWSCKLDDISNKLSPNVREFELRG